jgi:3',5'-cyclic AMP phosphodiesterase CpdA
VGRDPRKGQGEIPGAEKSASEAMVGELRLRLRLLDLLVTTGDLAVNGGHVATPLGVARLGSLGAPRCLTLGARSSLDLASHELLQGRGKVRV